MRLDWLELRAPPLVFATPPGSVLAFGGVIVAVAGLAVAVRGVRRPIHHKGSNRMILRRIVIVLLALLALAACQPAALRFDGIDITGATYAQDFSLTDHTGVRRTIADYKGKLVIVFFGFVQCPDVCPTTLSKLAEVKRQLGKDGDRLQAVFITIDPERDTQQVLAEFVPAFDPSFVGLRGTAEETSRTAQQFKVFYQKAAGQTQTSYTMDHTAGSYVFDPQGRIRLFLKHEQSVESVVGDLRKLLG